MSGKTFGTQDDFILNYRPTIAFVEPEQTPGEPHVVQPETTLDDTLNRADKVVADLNSIAALSDTIQQSVDAKVIALGGLDIKLDPNRDFATIAAMKRRFPEKKDPTTISYNDYRAALDCLQMGALALQQVDPKDVLNAQLDPFRTSFGGLDNVNGQNRPELSSAANIQPLNIAAFQEQALLALFKMLEPLITKLIGKVVGL
jgi:hypothetical protein